MLKIKAPLFNAKLENIPLCFEYNGKTYPMIDGVPGIYKYTYRKPNGSGGYTYPVTSVTLPEGYSEEDFNSTDPCLTKEFINKSFEFEAIVYPFNYTNQYGLNSLCYKNNDKYYDIFTNDIVNETGIYPCTKQEIVISEKNRNYLVITTGMEEGYHHNLVEDETIYLIRNNGDIHFKEEHKVHIIDHRRFYIENLPYITLKPYSIEKTEKIDILPKGETKYTTLVISFKSNPHLMVEDESVKKIAENFYTKEDFSEYKPLKNRKVGDLFTFNYNFLYKAVGVSAEDNTYIVNGIESLCNTKNILTYTIGGEEKQLSTFTPLNYGGKDNLYKIYSCLESNDTGIIQFNEIVANANEIYFIHEKDCFFSEDGGGRIKPQLGVGFYRLKGTLNLSIPLDSDIKNGLQREQFTERSLIEEKINTNLNKTVDFEKQVFEPYFKKNGVLRSVNKLKLNLFFRERSCEIETPEIGNKICDYGGWKTDDYHFWNNFVLNGPSDDKLVPRRYHEVGDEIITNGDLIGNLGFDDDDVYYRKNRLKQSFIRLLFFDTPYRSKNQKLLFYSTIFLDTGKLYSQYVNLINNKNVTQDDRGYAYTFIKGMESKLLTSNFEVADKYDATNSGEGYYIHLFPDFIKGYEESTIYMKVDFNSAKYGSVIPFVMPRVNGRIIEPTSVNFPFNYCVETGIGENKEYSVNMKRVNSDMYIKINTKFDLEKNKFIYYFDGISGDENDNITLNLYEPRLNRCNKDEKCKG